MSTLFTPLGEPMLAWLADYYLVATLLLLAALIGRQFVRQPAHRILIAWTAMLELVVLAVICALPFWPKISFVAAPAARAAAVAEPPVAEMPPMAEQPIAPMPSMRLPPMIGSSAVAPVPVEPSEPKVEAAPAPPQSQTTWSELAVAAYLAGVAMVGLWLCWGAAAASWLCWRAKPAADSLKAVLSQVVRGKGTEVVVAKPSAKPNASCRQPPPSPSRRREPRLLVSEEIANAVALGVLRPTIVLPDAMVQTSPPRTLRAVLLHEWAHIRHRDLWLLALGRLLLAILFTHPLFWLLRRAIRGDQELLADAVAAGDNPHDYAEELVRLVRMTGDNRPRSVSAAVGIWEGPSSFSRRITMLLDETFRVHTAGSRRWRFKALVAMTLVGLVCSMATLQPARSTGEQDQPATKAEMHAPRAAHDRQDNSGESPRANPQSSPAPALPTVTPSTTLRTAPSANPVDTTEFSEGFSRTAQILAASYPDWEINCNMLIAEASIFNGLSMPEFRKDLGVTAEQDRKLEPILKEFEREAAEGVKFGGRVMAVLTPEQRTLLRKEAMSPEGPVDSCSMSCSVNGEGKETKIPLPFPYPDLSDVAVQKSLGFSADQAKRVRAILGDSTTLCALLIREAARFTPAEREAQNTYYCFYTRYKSIGPNSLASPARRKQLWDKQAADRRAWRADRDMQPLVKRRLEVSKQLESVLTPEQTAKYQEMAYSAIDLAAINDPLTWAKLDASAEQNTVVLNICTETMTKNVNSAGTATKKILAILDRSQREKLREDLRIEKAVWAKLEQEIPQEPAAETSGLSAKPSATVSRPAVVSGQVVDYAGKGIAGADVGLQVYRSTGNTLPHSPLIAFAKADAAGRFRLAVPEVPDATNQNATVWAIADGYQPARPNWSRALTGLIRNGATVKLTPAPGVVLEIVRYVDGKKEPVSGVRVTVLSQMPEREVSFPIPGNWFDRVSGVSDADGRVRLANVIADGITDVVLQPADQSARIRLSSEFFLPRRPARSAPHFTCVLPETGNIEGRLDVQGGSLPPDLRITVQTRDSHRTGELGEATVAVDADGRFKVEEIAAGEVVTLPFLSDRQPLREQAPANVMVLPGETAKLTIPVRRGVLVRGQIRMDDTKQPCSQLTVRLLWGQSAMDNRGAAQVHEFKTDGEGRFSAIVPPGPLQVSPEHRLPYMDVESWRDPDGRRRYTVPAGKKSLDLEPIEVVHVVSLSGKLANLDNQPLGGEEWFVFGYPDMPGKDFHKVDNSFPGAHPEKDGRFSGWYPRTYPPVHWTVVHQHWPTPYKIVNDQLDAKVISRDPLVLQVPVHGNETAKSIRALSGSR